MPKDRKKERRGKDKPYVKGTQNKAATRDSNDEPETCCVCEEVIKESTQDGQPSDEAVYCEGGCAAWFHRKCSGLSKSAYAMAGESESPFYCVYCMQSMYKKEFIELREQIHTLTFKITELLESLHSQNTNQIAHSPTSVTPALPPTSKTCPTSAKLSKNLTTDSRQYNIVLYGLKEFPKGTSRSARMKQELDQIVEILTGIGSNVGPQNIRDSFRLGKYNESANRPRPILVKLNRSYDVSNLLSARKNLPKGLTIKPDLSPEERVADTILMKERWRLIQAGKNRNDIKIVNNKLLLKGKLHGTVVNSEFIPSSQDNNAGATQPQAANTQANNSSTMDTNNSDN